MKPTLTVSIPGILLPSFFLLSCGDTSGTGPPVEEPPGPASMVVAPEEITMEVLGETVQYSATIWDPQGRVLPDAPVTWYSSDETVVEVDSTGLATAMGNGEATVLAAASSSVFGWGTATVTAKPLGIVTSSLLPGVIDLPYHQQLTPQGANAPIWSLREGTLPPGLSLSEEGVISGIPTTPGESVFTIGLAEGDEVVFQVFTIAIIRQELGIDFEEEEFVLISAGTFQMGSEKSWSIEKPVHTVNITRSFLMQRTEVTQHQWSTIMDGNPSGYVNCGPVCPVERVSWEEATLFISRLNEADPGKNYRLPTEAEWEYAARAGTTGDFSGTGDPLEMGWFQENSYSWTHVVGQKAPNAWGLYDMHGNVAEWVQDWYSPTYYGQSPTDDPQGPPSGTYRVMRGSDCTQSSSRSQVWRRRFTDFYKYTATLGFRLVRDP